MKRRIEETSKVEGGPPQPLHIQRAPHTPSSIVQTTLASPTIKTVPSDLGALQHIPIQTTYPTMPSITAPIKVTGGMTTPPGGGGGGAPQFQRLKVEDALSYLDQVKYKFSSQPQVYNDFLDIMKEFKSQCIDTPGVITRVSNLFKGYPELIIGFNTFLPPGYKIEVKANDTGYSLQVSVTSMSSPPGGGVAPHHSLADMPSLVHTQSTINVVTNQPTKTSAPIFNNPVTNSVVRSSSEGGKGSNTERPASSPPPSTSLPLQSNHQTNQPVEFNHAINYVNKIKNRFQLQPEKYKRFLEILHTYQKEQRTAKNGGGNSSTSGGKQLTEAEVYSQVAKLFEHQEDLLTEFGQFLPDATSHNSLANLRNKVSTGLLEASHKASNEGRTKVSSKYQGGSGNYNATKSSPPAGNNNGGGGSGSGGSGPPPKAAPVTHTPTQSTKRSVQDIYTSTPTSHHQIKKHKPHNSTNLTNFTGFEKIKKNVSAGTYENLMRVLLMYNYNLVGRSELMLLVSSVLCKHPELVAWVRDLLANELHISPSALSPPPTSGPPPPQVPSHPPPHPTSPRPAVDLPQLTANTHNDLDLNTCRRIGTSYYALPKSYSYPKCSGRTALCKQVLNDSWVSIPAWSEDANFVTSKKTQYEEYIYKCEDERFELDVVIECNASTIMVLEGLMKKMARMSSEELSRFRLDDSLGGSSPTTYVRAIKKLYGEKASDIIEGLRKNPSVSVPIVLKRLKAKEVEWRQAQKGFNKVWGEQNEKYYLKSLDHQGINFKTNDVKALRSKTLYNEIEAACDDSSEDKVGPHLILPYKDRSVLDDAADLLIYHVKRQSQIHKEDKQRIKALLRHFLPDLFHHPRVELSDDEPPATPSNSASNLLNDVKPDPEDEDDDMKQPLPSFALSPFPDEEYTLFYGNNAWYLFMRLHHILCDRLTKMAEKAQAISKSEVGGERKSSTAVVLRLKPNEHVADRYVAMLDMVKSVLDCSMDLMTYEDNLRNMFGIHAYTGFTLDKVVTSAVRQLQTLVTEDACMECWDLHSKEKLKGGAGGLCKTYHRRAADEANYQRQASLSVTDNCYKMYIYKKDCKLTIELLDSEGDDEVEEDNVAKNQEKWSAYTEMHTDPSQTLDPLLNAVHRDVWSKAVYLRRNLKRWNQRVTKKRPDNNSSSTNGIEGQKIESSDETQCRILSNNKMIFVVNKDSCLYKKEALLKAKESHQSISKHLYERFSKWYNSWSERHVSEDQREEANSWLLGMRPDAVPNLTILQTYHSLDSVPYRSYNRYRVESPVHEDSYHSSSSSSE